MLYLVAIHVSSLCQNLTTFVISGVYSIKEFSPPEHGILLHCIHVFSLRCIFAGFLLTVPSCWRISWSAWYYRCPLICLFKQAAHLLVGGLRKLSVPVADCYERLRSYNAYDLIYFSRKLIGCRGRGSWNSDDDAAGMSLFDGRDSSMHRCSGRNAIVHKYDSATAYVIRGAFSTIEVFASLQFL